MTCLKGAEIIVDYLVKERIPYLIGLCGHGDVGLMDAALDRQDKIKTVSTHNEQIAGFMADAYFRVSGQPVATFTSCGPGSVNIQMAIACALFDASPLLAITGNVPTQQFNRGPFQEFGHHYQADFVSAMRPYVKRSFQATRADMLPDMMRDAYRTMVTGRPGPVHLDIPFNVFTESAEVSVPEPGEWHGGLGVRSQGEPASVARALELLSAAERPLVLAGYGCTLSGAGAALVQLAERLRLPVATTPQGRGAFDEAHPLSVGPTGRDGVYAANRAARACDVLLALGTRFGDRSTSSWEPGITHRIPPTRLIHVDHDPAQLGKNYPTSVGIAGDVRLVLAQLLDQALCANPKALPQDSGWLASIERWKRAWADALATTSGSQTYPIHPDRLMRELSRALSDDTILVSDIGAHHSWMVQQCRIPPRGRLLQSGGFAAMGFGVGGALGAQLAAPDRGVVAVVGDGGFLMHASAVATAVEYELPVVWVVWNNMGFVSIRDLQAGFFGPEREFATRFRSARSGKLISTDFAKLGEAMGAQGIRIERAAELGDVIAAALAARRPTVIDVAVQADVRRRTAGGWSMPPLATAAPNFDPDPLGVEPAPPAR
ncbi:MAG: thiamine pyrophosphate-binding protein [Burkholderiales bacterium]|nr:thiamine pyrophosphate-binding protein [Burkholderiales bacterium]